MIIYYINRGMFWVFLRILYWIFFVSNLIYDCLKYLLIRLWFGVNELIVRYYIDRLILNNNCLILIDLK